jgi:RNA polymerase sigma factor (TIGR02999 family)
MRAQTSQHVTQLLVAWSNGDEAALESLTPLIYDELRRLARHYMKDESPGHTLQATALVHEAYLQLIEQKQVKWQNRAHFFAISAKLMRRVLVSMARARHAHKRGGASAPLSLDEASVFSQDRAAELVALDDALKALEELDKRKSQVVEMRFFGGLSVEETAEVLKVSPDTVMRDWKRAKAWLYSELSRTGTSRPWPSPSLSSDQSKT